MLKFSGRFANFKRFQKAFAIVEIHFRHMHMRHHRNCYWNYLICSVILYWRINSVLSTLKSFTASRAHSIQGWQGFLQELSPSLEQLMCVSCCFLYCMWTSQNTIQNSVTLIWLPFWNNLLLLNHCLQTLTLFVSK